MSKHNRFNNTNNFNKNIGENTAVNINNNDDTVKDTIENNTETVELKLDANVVIDDINKVDIKKDININKYINEKIKEYKPKFKVYSPSPDINLFITTYIKCNRDIKLTKKALISLGYLDIIIKDTDNDVSFKWNNIDINYLKSDL